MKKHIEMHRISFSIESKKFKDDLNRIDDSKSINHTILETVTNALGSAGAIWAIVYAILTYIGSSTALRGSLEIFVFFFLLIIYLKKK